MFFVTIFRVVMMRIWRIYVFQGQHGDKIVHTMFCARMDGDKNVTIRTLKNVPCGYKNVVCKQIDDENQEKSLSDFLCVK